MEEETPGEKIATTRTGPASALPVEDHRPGDSPGDSPGQDLQKAT